MRRTTRLLIVLTVAASLGGCRDDFPTAVAPVPVITPQFTLVQGPVTPRSGGVINSSIQTVANGSLGEYSPRVSEDGNLVCYSDFAIRAVRYWSFTTGLGGAVPQSGEQCAVDRNLITSALSIPDGEDSYGGRRAIMLFNMSASFAMELDQQLFSLRGQPAIGNNTVAFVEDIGTGWDLRVVAVSPPGPSWLVNSEEGLIQRSPNISPDGNVIVWERCDAAFACQLMKAVRSSAGWTVQDAVGDEDQETGPDTDGAYIAYAARFVTGEDTETDIFIQAVAGGPVMQLVIPGLQFHPRITRGIISFTTSEFDFDTQTRNSFLHVYVLSTNTLYKIGAAAGAGSNDLAILTNGEVRMVWDVPGARATETADIFATRFTLPGTFAFGGFLEPVNNPPTVNVARAGGAIPVKFSLGADRGLSIFGSGSPSSATVTCNAGAAIDAVEETVTAGGSTLTFDATSAIYSYIWKTDKAWANTCRRLTLRFTDGSVASADFQFK